MPRFQYLTNRQDSMTPKADSVFQKAEVTKAATSSVSGTNFQKDKTTVKSNSDLILRYRRSRVLLLQESISPDITTLLERRMSINPNEHRFH
mmetsp:Transcript_50750/g.69055  ORF Transcript_50750/g.69055 Transcript_50750/m.69055 type:complete len:92 (+) Transcript_50750:539-814(+)